MPSAGRSGSAQRLDPAATDAEQNALLAEMLATALFAGEEAVRHTPEQLDVLAKAGVVDAGALGLVVIIRGLVSGLAGEQVQLPEIPHYAAARLDQVHHADSAYRYCTNFIVTGEGLAGDSFVGALEGLGDSVLVVGDAATLKVHVHTDDPDAARAAFDGAGEISRVDIADMHEQVAGQRARLGPGACRGGRGHQRRGDEGDVRGARRALRRRRANPEPANQGHPRGDRVLRRRRGPGAPQLAQRDHGGRGGGTARGKAGRTAIVVPSEFQQAGLAVMVEFDPIASAEENAERLGAGLAGIRVGAVAPAARDDAARPLPARRLGRLRGRRDRRRGGAGSTLVETVGALADGAEIVTVIEGAEAPICGSRTSASPSRTAPSWSCAAVGRRTTPG